MQFDFTIGTASSNLHGPLARNFKACNAQGRTMICLCLSLSKQRNLIMVLGLSVQQLFLWAQLMQLEFTMFDTSNNKFSAYISEEESRISRMSLSEYPNRRISPYMEFEETSVQPSKAKSWPPLLSVSNCNFQVLLQTIGLHICPWIMLGMAQSSLV